MGSTTARLGVALAFSFAFTLILVQSSFAAPPGNDSFAAAEVLSGLPVAAAGSNVGATEEAEEPTHEGGFAGHSVWYSWQAPSTAVVTVGTCDSDFNAVLAVYEGSALGALDLVESDVFSTGPNCNHGYRSEVTFKAFAGRTYKIEVDGSGIEFESPEQEEAFPEIVPEGAIALTIAATAPPVNDDFADARVLNTGSPLASETVFGGNWGATSETGEPDHAGVSGGASIWYWWTPSHAGTARAVGCARQIAVYTGTAVDALTPVASDAGYGGPCPVVSFPVVSGVRYAIALDNAFDPAKGYVPMTSTYLILSLPPENDDFDDATVLPSTTPVAFHEWTEGAAKEPGEPDHAGNGGGSSVWFSWTAPKTEPVVLTTCASSFDTLLAVYTGGSLGSLTQVASNDNAAAPGCSFSLGSELTFGAVAGVTYRFAVDGRDGTYGGLSLRLTGAPKTPVSGPRTSIRRRHVDAAERTATFHFRGVPGTAPLARFVCRLDRRKAGRCASPKTYRHLEAGWHRFSVWAVDAAGVRDPSAASARFMIPRRHAARSQQPRR